MKINRLPLFAIAATLMLASCSSDDSNNSTAGDSTVNFSYASTVQIGGEDSAEISAFDASTNRLFVVNADTEQIDVVDLTNVNSPFVESSFSVSGSPNSVSVKNGMLAIAIQGATKQDPGKIGVYNTSTLALMNEYETGPLPDMVTFTPDGKYIISANEGEPNVDYDNDPEGTITIVDVDTETETQLNFQAFNSQESALEADGYRVFGPGADLATDTEPEYVAVSDDSKTAWVSLQENNGLAKVNLETKTIEAILPLGFKDHSMSGNEMDPSNEDDVEALRTVPVFGMYQPDAIEYVNIGGTGYVISANEGDARDYDGYSEEDRFKDFDIDSSVNLGQFSSIDELKEDENLGRLKTTSTGDTDGDGDLDVLYSYGARSFSIWSEDGDLVFDSGNDIESKILELAPDLFVENRSDDKGPEPEAVESVVIGNRTILFVGLERSSAVMVYDISNPSAPEFIQFLSRTDDIAPEGVLAVPASESPSGKDLLIVANEVSGTVSIYENE